VNLYAGRHVYAPAQEAAAPTVYGLFTRLLDRNIFRLSIYEVLRAVFVDFPVLLECDAVQIGV
jgi:hypothetical protein